jgi:hypothetical protein
MVTNHSLTLLPKRKTIGILPEKEKRGTIGWQKAIL